MSYREQTLAVCDALCPTGESTLVRTRGDLPPGWTRKVTSEGKEQKRKSAGGAA